MWDALAVLLGDFSQFSAELWKANLGLISRLTRAGVVFVRPRRTYVLHSTVPCLLVLLTSSDNHANCGLGSASLLCLVFHSLLIKRLL